MSDFKERPPLPDDWTREHVEILKAAAKRDDAAALAQLGDMYIDGLQRSDGSVLLRRDQRAARRHLERGAALGDLSAMVSLAGMLTQDKDARSVRRGIALYERSFRAGDTTAGYNLAATYKRLGRHRDAFRWFSRAHRAGDPSALLQVAHAQLYGIGTRRDPVKALANLRRVARGRTKWWPASTGENVEAMLVIADALMEGWLLPRDYNEAIRWLRRAARYGNPIAIATLEQHGQAG